MSAPLRSVLGRESAWLATGSLLNGLAAFLLIGLGTRVYGAAGFAPVAIVWSVWSLTAAVLVFPMQHWTIRERRRGTSSDLVQATFTHVAVRVLGAAALIGVGATVVGDAFLRTDALTSPVTIVVLVAMGVPLGHVLGTLVATDRYRHAGLLIAGENLLRLLTGVAVVLAGLSVDWFMVVLAVGPVVMIKWVGVLRPAPSGTTPTSIRDVVELSTASIVAQVTLTGGPIVLAVLGAPDRLVGALFATMAVARAPYLVLLGASMRLTALWSAAGERPPARRVALATVCFAAVGALVGATAGPWFIEALFGPQASLSAGATAAVAAGGSLALGTLVLTALYTTEDDTRGLTRGWAVAFGIGTAGLLVPSSPLVRTLTWFVLTEALAVLVLGLGGGAARRRRPRR